MCFIQFCSKILVHTEQREFSREQNNRARENAVRLLNVFQIIKIWSVTKINFGKCQKLVGLSQKHFANHMRRVITWFGILNYVKGTHTMAIFTSFYKNIFVRVNHLFKILSPTTTQRVTQKTMQLLGPGIVPIYAELQRAYDRICLG